MVHVPTIDGGPNVQFYSCPPGYCQCFLNTSVGTSRCASVYRNSDPDQQCVCDRKGKLTYLSYWVSYQGDTYIAAGYLCGECGNGRGVSALLNNCVTCSDAFSLLIPILGKHIYLFSHYVVYMCYVVSECTGWAYCFHLSINTVIGDVLAMLVILLTRLRLPEWLYPSLFYIQVFRELVYLLCLN